MCKLKKLGSRIARLSLSVLLMSAWGIGLTQSFAQPVNDNFEGARLIGDGAGNNNDTQTITGNNEGGTKESGEGDHAGMPGNASVWFAWTPEADGIVTFDTLGSDFDTLLEAYDGSNVSSLADLGAPLASNDDVDPAVFGLQNATGVSSIQFPVTAGNTYYIVVDGFNGDTGSYNLNWKRGGTRASGEFEFTSTNYFATANEGRLDYSDRNGNQGVNRDVPGVLVTVTRKNGSSGRVMVDYQTEEIIPDPLDVFAPFPAVADTDFVSTSGTLVFEDYQMSASFIVPILNANFSGSGSNAFTVFNVVLTDASLDFDFISDLDESADLAPPTINPLHGVATVAIADPNPFPHGPRDVPTGTLNDQAGSVQFERAHYRRTEGVGTASIRVVREGGNATERQGSVTVEYQIYRANFNGDPRSSYNIFPLSAGSDYATPDTENNGDYTAETQIRTLTIGTAGFAYIDIPITEDSLAEFNEDIIIQLVPRTASPSPALVQPTDTVAAHGYEIGFQNVAILTIMHDDYPAGAVDPTHNPDYNPSTNPARNSAPGTDGSVYTVAVQPDGKTVLGGSFQNYNGTGRHGIARMNSDGSVDTTFNPGDGANGLISSLQLDANGKIVIGGGFSAFNSLGRKSLARLNANGTLDTTFNPGSGANAVVRSVALQSDGKVLIGGEFTLFNGTNRNHVARLNPDGSVDGAFNPGVGPDDTVFAIAAEADGSVLIGGDFMSVGDESRQSIARLNADGSVNTNFDIGTGANGTIYSIVPQSDGKVLIGGAFSRFNNVPRNSIARLNQDGSLDTTFDCGTGANDTVYAITLQPDGKILLGGLFTSINGTRRMGVARLFAHGPVDTSFLDTAYNQFAGLVNSFDNPEINSRNYVFALGLESNGNVIIGGGFSKVGGGRGSKEVRPEQYDDEVEIFGGNYLDENTRATYRNRSNIARLLGGATPGPGNIEFSMDNYSVSQNATPFFVTLVRTNYSTDTNYLGAVMASFTTRTLAPGSGVASEEDVLLDPKYSNPRWGSSWNRTNKLAFTRMQSDGFYGANSATLPFADTYNDQGLFANEGEAFVFLDIAPNSAANEDKTIKLELNRPKGTRIYDNSGFSPLDFVFPGFIFPLDFFSSSYFYFDPRDLDPFSLAQTDPNLEWSLGGEVIPLGTALGRSSATLTIHGNDNRGIFMFGAPEYVVNEEGTNAIINVSRTSGSKGSVTVQYATADGTNAGFNAIRNLDYSPTNGTLTFAEGATNQIIRVRILNDTIRENDESFTVRLFNPTGGAKIDTQTTTSVKIIDNDYLPGHLNLSAANFSIREGQSVASISVARTGGSLGTLTAQVSTVPGGTATENEDYTGVTNTLTWNSGDIANKTLIVPILNDGLVEGSIPETVFLRVTNTTLNGSSDTNVLGTLLTAQLQIEDDDNYGNFGFNSGTYYANENSGGMIVTIVRTNGSAGTVSLTCSITSGASITVSNLTFGPGEISKGILIPISNNDTQNSNLTIDLALSNLSPAGAVLSRPNAALIVVDDESNNEPPGGIDTTFQISEGANGFVYALALQPDGKILVGGDFTSMNSVGRNRIARLNNNGTTDAHFSSAGSSFGANGSVRAIAPQSNGRILVGGLFTTINGTDRGHIARLNSNGTSDITFNPGTGADSPVHALAETFVSGARKILVAGNFTTFDGVQRHGIVRLNENGTIDYSFNPGLGISSTNGAVYSIAVQNDGKVVLGGDFTSFNGMPSPHIVRLQVDGSVDPTFNPGVGPNDSVRAIALQTDNKIIIGGHFHTVSGVSASRLARLNPNGSLDLTFLSGVGANDSVYTIALQLDGKIVVGGEFTQASGVTRNRLTRLNPDGTVDPTINFGTGADDFIAAMALQPDGKIIIGGGFTEFDGTGQPHIARIHGRAIEGDGKLEFVSADFVANENGTNALITVRRTGGTGSPAVGSVFVDALTSDGTAQNGLDYTSVAAHLEFPVGETRQVFSIPMIDDNLVEPSETVHLNLSNPIHAVLGDQPVATLTIKNDDAAISFSSATYRFAENAINGTALISISRSGSAIGTASVDFTTTTNGTATANVDFTPVTNTVFFADGETNQLVAVPLATDSLIEGDETVTMELGNANGAILSQPIAATLTIVDANFGPGSLMFSKTNYTVGEGAGFAVISVTRTNGSQGFVSVSYSAGGAGTATAAVDYSPTNGTLTFGPGELTKTFSVRILEDAISEGNETLQLTLSNPTGGSAIVSPNSIALTIVDNDAAFSFSTPAYVANEGEGGVTITVRRENDSNGVVTVFYKTTDASATNNLDYIGRTNSLVFADGELLKTFTIPILEDSLVEGDETFFVSLFNPSAGTQLSNPSNAVVTIVDNDSSLSFSAATFVVDEGSTNAVITVSRTNTSSGTVSVQFATSNGTALSGSDYTSTNGTLIFLDGDTTKTFSVRIADDTLVEGDETFTVTLTNPSSGARLGSLSVSTVTISDNDAGLRFSSPNYSVSESGVSASITVLRTTVTNSTVSVNYSVANGTAADGSDYTGQISTLTFTNGEISKTFIVPIIDDTVIEGDETVLLTLFSPSGAATLINPGAAVLTIVDNDGSLIVPAGSALISESLNSNGVIDPSETVSLYFAFRNTVGVNTTDLHATLLSGNGINSPSGEQSYGALAVNSASVSRPFSFTASGTNGQQIKATFHLQDGAFDLGTATFTYTLGSSTVGFTNSNPIIINDSSAPPTLASPYPSTINVSGVLGTVNKISVTLSNLNHSFPDDVDILLVSPSGQKVVLMSDAGGATLITNRTITFDDSASSFLPDSSTISSGNFKPSDYTGGATDFYPLPAPNGPYSSTLSVLNGANPNGVWSLFVVDDSTGANGSIAKGWSLSIGTASVIPAVADLSIGISDRPDPAATNNTLIYTISITNHGPSAASGIVISNVLPQGMVYLADTCNCVSNANNTLLCPLANLAKDGTATFEIWVTPTVVGVFTNTVTIRGNESDPNLVNNTASTVTTVDIPRADLSISLSDSPDPVQINNDLTYTIVLRNLGPSAVSGIVITNPLPQGAVFVSASMDNGTYTYTNGTLIMYPGDLIAPTSLRHLTTVETITVVVRPTVAGIITNLVTVTSAINDPFKANNTASVKTLVELPPLALTASFNGLTIEWGTNAPGYVLESTKSLSQPAVWLPVTNPPVVIQNGKNRCIVDLSEGTRFFRLNPQAP